jgi:Zn-dependent peptidase ImmA (M78 family)/transcriptional regulator with XRE-family HTH domain
MTSTGAALLDAVFGPGEGVTPEARAAESRQRFVRGLDQLSFDESPAATGRRLTAREALDAYGFERLCEVALDGSALLVDDPRSVGRNLKERREQLGLPVRSLASKTGYAVEVIEALEASKRRPIREYEAVASVLGLDERLISSRTDRSGNERLAVRLRQLADDRDALQPAGVVALSEAAWVAMTQLRLEDKLGVPRCALQFSATADYGDYRRPAYSVGYELADRFRAQLGLGERPIESMRDLVERRLAIPVVQAALGERIAGATVRADNGRRAIVLNIQGKNADASVRRSTLAHELCHLLFDPDQLLLDLRVDEYAELDARADLRTDRVEQRANAFAVQLLAPQAAAVDLYAGAAGDGLRRVLDRFGISFTAGRYQVWNGLERAIPLDSITARNQQPKKDWEGREAYTLVFHPIGSLVEHPARAGRFSAVVVAAAERGLITWDTAASWLRCDEREIRAAVDDIHGLFPDVFRAA